MPEIQLASYEKKTHGKNTKNDKKLKPLLMSAVSCLLGIPFAAAMPYGGIAPFGLSFLSRERKFSFKALLTLAAVCLGSLAACDRITAAKYIGAGILYISVLFVLEKGIKFNTAAAAVTVGLSLIPPGLTALRWQGFSVISVLLLICEAALSAAGAFIIDKALSALEKRCGAEAFGASEAFGAAEALGADERIAVTTAVIIAVLGLKPIYIGAELSVMNIAASAAVMLVSFSCGMNLSAVSGIIWGIACGIGSDFFMPILGTFAFCGFMSGVFSKFGKGGTIAGMITANAILVVYTNSNMTSVLSLYEVMVSAVIFAFIPSRTSASVRELLLLDTHDKESIARLKDNVKSRLSGVSHAFAALAHTLERISDKEKEADVNEVAEIFDLAADKICKNCRKSAVCWGKDFNSTYKSLFRLLEITEERGTVDVSDVTDQLRDKCLNLPKLLGEINTQYDLFKVRRVWKDRLSESRELVGEQLSGVSDIIESIAEEIENDSENGVDVNEIQKRLEQNGIYPSGISTSRDRSGRHTVKIELSPENVGAKSRRTAFDTMKALIPHPIDMNERKSKNGTSVIWEFSETELFEVEVGYACAGASSKNGDNFRFSRPCRGKYAVILSDGMGTGERASRESTAVTELLEGFIRAGFNSELAVKLINSIMVIKSENSAFATLDMCVIDLYTGNAEFIKTGAEPSFIIRKNSVETVRAASLPVGVVAKMETFSSFVPVYGGDTVVMMTDGIKGKADGTKQIREFMERERFCSADKLADGILRRAAENLSDSDKDDMTVITLKLRQKSELLRIA